KWLAYMSTESGRMEVYVRPIPGPGGRLQISTDGASEPVWTPSGQELFYRANGKIMSARITWSSAGNASVTREALFDDNFVSNANSHPVYDIMPDGQHFVFVQSAGADVKTVVVLNWFEEVRQKMAAASRR